MKKTRFIFIIILLLLLSPVFPQQAATTLQPSTKYGKPSEAELTLSVYPPDTTATALYLFHQGETNFTYRDGFQLVTEHWIRIKILKPQGASYADVSIPYYSPANSSEDKENASEVDGCSYNMEQGKCVKTFLKKDLISRERINDRFKTLKFSIPAVKAGTVIEYHYKLTSDYFTQIDNWVMQDEIPVLYNQYKIAIPNVFLYNIEFRGKDYITTKERSSSMHATVSQGSGIAVVKDDLTITSRELTFTSQNLPALRQDESYIWCPEDYRIQISFDLEGTHFPGQEYEPVSRKWEDVDKQLLKSENEQFGKLLSQSNPFRDITWSLSPKEMSFDQKVITAFQTVKKQLAWNGKYLLYSKNLEKVIKEKSGSNADLNFILISVLKDYGLKAYPVVLSRRSSGILPVHFPSLQKLNTFIVAIHDEENKKYIFLDCSMDQPAFDVLPLDLSASKARILAPTESEENKWINLITLPSNGTSLSINATIQPDQIKGHRIADRKGQHAIEYLKKERSSETNTPHADESAAKDKLILSNLKTSNQENNFAHSKEECDFSMPIHSTDERLYINPLLFPHLENNPFIQSERVMPVEFSYPYKYSITSLLTLPEGYEIEEMPASQSLRTEDNALQCKYLITKKDNTLMLNYLFVLKSYLFSPEQYQQLQNIWTTCIEKNQALIVLKKTEQNRIEQNKIDQNKPNIEQNKTEQNKTNIEQNKIEQNKANIE